MDWLRVLRRATVSGTVASVVSSLALAALARGEGKGALQPVNATSHWLNGEAAASRRVASVADTAVGYATHNAATIFWALLFEAWLGAGRPTGLLTRAAATSVIAAAVDYGATPRRFTPGWEFVLSKRSMASAYAAMAAGLALGSVLARRSPDAG